MGSGVWSLGDRTSRKMGNRERIHPQNGPGTGNLEKIGTLARPKKSGRLFIGEWTRMDSVSSDCL